MLPKNLLSLLGALMLLLWTSPSAHSQSTPDIPVKKQTCGDLWPVKQGKKWGYIDKTGRLIIPFKFNYASGFSDGLAAVSLQGKYGYIDRTGEFVIPPRFDSGFPFSEGLALVLLGQVGQEGLHPFYQYGYIDRSGQVVIRPTQDPETLKWFSMTQRGLAFSEGLAYMAHGKLGYIDKAGRQVVPPRYNDVQPFSEGLAAVKLGDQYGYIDRSGKMVILPRFEEAGSFSEKLASIKADGKWGYIDKSGRMIINGAEFVWARGFSEGLAAIMGKDYKYGYIDKTGKIVIPLRFERVGDFSEGVAPVMPVEASWPGDLDYINHKGQIVIKSRSTVPDRPMRGETDLHYYRFCGGVARVSLGNERDPDAEGYINKEGKFIWPKALR